MRHIHHPLVGDPLYGKGNGRMNLDLDRQFLHSWSVQFEHPITGEVVSCRDELPWDLAAALEELHEFEGAPAVHRRVALASVMFISCRMP